MNEILKPNVIEDPAVSFYENHGHDYVANQREFYAGNKDTGREFFRSALAPNISMLTIADIGCGAGDDTVTYKQMGAARVIGIEPSKVMLGEAKKSVQASGLLVELLPGQWNKIPLPDESVDALTARYSFHVLSDFERAFREAARVLKKGGIFLIGAPHPLHDARVVREQNLKPGEKMKVLLFNGKFTVDIPPHTLEEYLSKTSREYFEVVEQVGYSMHEDQDEREPSGLLLKLRKK